MSRTNSSIMTLSATVRILFKKRTKQCLISNRQHADALGVPHCMGITRIQAVVEVL